ncbi:MAG: hypothetical protein RLZZ618_1816 [Pseudomonadota bacterium]|jgi:hypothetical protein
MAAARWVFLLLGLAAIVSFGFFVITRDDRYRRVGLFIVKGAVFSGLVFFAVLAIERLAESP